MIFHLFFLFFFSSSFLLASLDSLENPCVFHGVDYNGLSEFPDIPLSVSTCRSSAVNDYLFSLCRPLNNSIGKSLNASAVLIGSNGPEAIGIFPAQTILTPAYQGNISQGITIKASAGSQGPQIFINIYCMQNNPLSGQNVPALLNPWLGQQTIVANQVVDAEGQCDTLELDLFSNCVCPGYGENPLKPCSPPMRPSGISMAFENPSGSLAQPGPNGEILSVASVGPSTIALTTLIPQAFDPVKKIPLNYSSNTAKLEIPKGLQYEQIGDFFPDDNEASNDFYLVTSVPIPAWQSVEYSFFLVNGNSLTFLFSSNVSGYIVNCVSRPNLFPHATTKTIVCLEYDFGLPQCSLGEYVYEVRNSSNLVKKAVVYPSIMNCLEISLSFDSSKILMVSGDFLFGFDVRSKRIISNITLPYNNNMFLGLAVDDSLDEENGFFLLQTTSLDFPNFPANDYGVYQLVGKEFLLINDLPDMIAADGPINFFIDSFGCQWLLVGNSLLRVDPAGPLKNSNEKENNKIYQLQ